VTGENLERFFPFNIRQTLANICLYVVIDV
jgi:hypothetical protein